MPTGIYKRKSTQGFQKGNKFGYTAMLGKHHTDETKELMKKAHKGNHPKTEFKKGYTPWNKGRKYPEFSGENSYSWKGGKVKANNRWIIYKPEHPNAVKKYVLQYRLIAEKILGRYLTKIEVIHHINGDSLDDRPENLYLFENTGEHMKYHYLKIKKIITKSNLFAQGKTIESLRQNAN